MLRDLNVFVVINMMDLDNVIKWLSSRNYVDARRLAKAFNISSYRASKILSELRRLGYVSIYRRRRGRFWIYKVNSVITVTEK